METEKCRTLLYALELGSITAVADYLGYSTSGVSRMLAALEEETGFPLLRRSHNGVAPTRECEALLPTMRELVHQAACYQQTASALRGLDAGTITIGMSYGGFFRRVTKLMAVFRTQYPNVVFRTVEGTSTELSQALEEHRVDFCIISRREGNHRWIQLKRDELLLMLPENHPLAEKERIPLSCLANETFIEIYPDQETDNSRCLAENGILTHNRFSCAYSTSAMAMVEAGLGVTMMNAIIAETLCGQVAIRSLDPPQYIDMGIAAPPAHAMAPAARQFLEFVERELGEL